MSKQSEIFHALQFKLTAWLIDLDAALKICFPFKAKEGTFETSHESLSTDLVHTFYKVTTLTARTEGQGPKVFMRELSVSFQRKGSPLAENFEFCSPHSI